MAAKRGLYRTGAGFLAIALASLAAAGPGRADDPGTSLGGAGVDALERLREGGGATTPGAGPRDAAGPPVPGSAAGEGGADLSADNLRWESRRYVLEIPHLELHGAALPNFLGSSTAPGADASDALDAFLRFRAARIVAPELILTRKSTGTNEKDQRLTLRNLSLSAIDAGKIGALNVGSMQVSETTQTAGGAAITVDGMEARDIDLALAAAIARRARTTAESTLRPVLGRLSVTNTRFSDGKGSGFTIGSLGLADLEGRPLDVAPARIAELSGKPEAERSPAEKAELTEAVRDGASSSALGRLEFRDVGFVSTEPNSVTFDLESLVLDGLAGPTLRHLGARHLTIGTSGAVVKAGGFALDGFDETAATDTLAGDRNALAHPWLENVTKLSPRFSSASLDGLSVVAPVEDNSGNANAGRKLVIDAPSVRLAVSKEGDGATTASGSLRVFYDIASPAPGSSLDKAKRNGFDHFDLTEDAKAGWNGIDGRLDVAHGVALKDLASLALGGSVTGVTASMLDGNLASRLELMGDVRFQRFAARLANLGLAEKALPLLASANATSVPELKAGFKKQADDALADVLGAGEVTDRVMAAVNAFIDDPKSLSVTVTAPGGRDLRTLLAAKSPAELLQGLSVEATANR